MCDMMELYSCITEYNVVLSFPLVSACVCVCHNDECLCFAGAREQLSVDDTTLCRW